MIKEKNEHEQFQEECTAEIAAQGSDEELAAATDTWFLQANAKKYSYHFRWLGRPIIQYPQDIVAMQELIWRVQPDLIIETGIAHGGSLIFSASMLAVNAECGGPRNASVLELILTFAPTTAPPLSNTQCLVGSTCLKGQALPLALWKK